MGVVERIRNLDAVPQHLLDRQRASHQSGRERLALEILHDEEAGAVLLADIEERTDVGMMEARDGPGFLIESSASLRLSVDVGAQYFDGDDAIQARVPCPVDLAHAASAKE